MSQNEQILEFMRADLGQVMAHVPWAKALGFEFTGVERGKAFGKIAYAEHLIGDPDSGVIHGGVITALLDNLCGTAVVAALDELKSTATLDLRIDYMRPADKGRDVIGEAECYHVTRTVAFVRAWAYHDSRDKVIATAAGAFALNDLSRWSSRMGQKMAAEDGEGQS